MATTAPMIMSPPITHKAIPAPVRAEMSPRAEPLGAEEDPVPPLAMAFRQGVKEGVPVGELELVPVAVSDG